MELNFKMIEIKGKEYVCSLDYAVDLIKSKWKAVIICHLNVEPKRFLELQRITSGISHKVLTERLKELESDGLVERIVYSELPPRVEYRLTQIGINLFKVLEQLESWSTCYIEKTLDTKTGL